ncbi:hypothetical protein PV327_007817 [Microctonus hyperodae]|uniref:Uncharacterized protein n=1 Tax=Microctonus hyperodae TaxID=165561 RepID=A0AA39KZ05_MICHY|nr:hypothetical protein PV327_007817 [Microctonus hyperodae]
MSRCVGWTFATPNRCFSQRIMPNVLAFTTWLLPNSGQNQSVILRSRGVRAMDFMECGSLKIRTQFHSSEDRKRPSGR